MTYNVNMRANYKIGVLDNTLILKKDLTYLIKQYEEYVRGIEKNHDDIIKLTVHSPHDDAMISHKTLVFILKYQSELNVFSRNVKSNIEKLNELLVKIDLYHNSPEKTSVIESYIVDNFDELRGSLNYPPTLTWEERNNLRELDPSIAEIIKSIDEQGGDANRGIYRTNETLNILYNSMSFYIKSGSIHMGTNQDYIFAFKFNEEEIERIDNDISEIENSIKNDGLSLYQIEQMKTWIEAHRENKERNIEENKKLKVFFDKLGISKDELNVDVAAFGVTQNDISGKLTISIANFKVWDTDSIMSAANKVGLIQPRYTLIMPEAN